jgi:hypothetical protein
LEEFSENWQVVHVDSAAMTLCGAMLALKEFPPMIWWRSGDGLRLG